jgi:DNA repair protein RecO (recombination protein O)
VDVWPALFVRFEMALLDETGFGLDLSTCAASGSHLNLTHISPRSGRAVSAEAAEPYRDKLFAMPDFLSDSAAPVSASDILDGFEITGHFLAARLLHNLDQAMPEARDRMLTLLKRDF